MSDHVLLYVTTANEEEAVKIAHALVGERLVACVNMMAPVRSFFRWEGEVHDDREVVFVAKTLLERVDQAARRIRELHSYDVPAIIAFPIVAGDQEFIGWISEECQ